MLLVLFLARSAMGFQFQSLAAVSLMLAVGNPLVWLALFGILSGPCAGPIMALPARALRAQLRSVGMGIYYTWYYAAMALLPPLAGLFRDLTGRPSAPLLFGSALLVLAAGALLCFTRYAGGPWPLSGKGKA
jgi:hypothetical protein